MHRRSLKAAAAAAAFALLLSACSGGGGDGGGDGSELYVAVPDDPICLDPQQVTMTTALNIGRQFVDSLVDEDPDSGELVGWLAESYETNADLTEFTFTLRDGVTFSDGTPLTAETVKANFDALSVLGGTAPLASQYLAGYTETRIDDERTATVVFGQTNAQFLRGASTMTLGLLSDPNAALSADERCAAPIGSGPFVLDSYQANDSVNLVRRDGYAWGSSLRENTGEAYLGSIVFAITPEVAVRTGGLQTGEFDVMLDLQPEDEERFQQDEGFTVLARPNPGIVTSLVPNTTRPVVSDEAVRKAMLLATDRTEIRDLTGSSLVEPASSVLSSVTTGHIDLSAELAVNQAEAARILDEAGWTTTADGSRRKDGQGLTMTATAFYGQNVLEAAQIQLAEVGIDLQINMVTAGDFFGAIGTGDYDFVSAALTRDDPDALRVMFSSAADSRWAIIEDPELEAVLLAQAAAVDETERMTLIAEAQERIIASAYVVPLLQVAQVHAASADVSGVAFDSASRLNFYEANLSS